MTPLDYQKAALRTLYPDLTTNERIGLCGLGLTGETGEVADLLKKHRYHRNGKPFDTAKLKDELGDVMWYFFVLLDTVGLTFEQVVETIKLEQTIAFGLDARSRLSFCGLELAGHLGRVAERLCSALYKNIPLDTNELKERLANALRYFLVLLDTLGITFEEVLQTNANKLEARHANGFNARYQSDSGASA